MPFDSGDAEPQELRQQLSVILNSMEEGIHVLDPDGRILFENLASARMFGWNASEMLRRPAHELVHHSKPDGSDYPLHECPIYQTLQDGESRRAVDELFWRRDGTPFAVEFMTVPMRDKAGNLSGVVVLFSDITDRRKTEASLRESEEQFRQVVLESPFPMLLHAEGGAILLVSRAWTEISGYSHKDIPTMADWIERAYGEEKDEVAAEIGKLYTLRERVYEGEYEVLTRQGETRIWDFSSAPAGRLPDGRRLVISMAMDVTDRKHAEGEIHRLNEELEQRVHDRTAQLEAALGELEAFSYSVSHDLRAPLRGIDSFSRIVLEDYGPVLDDEGKRLLNIVRDEAQRMAHLIDDLLRFSRMGRQELRAANCDMTRLVQSTFDALPPADREHVRQFELKPLPPAYGDYSMLKQVLFNLLANAVKFTQDEAGAAVEVGGWTADDVNTYYVKDHGVGFDPQYAHKLFGVFQRLHGEDEFEGTGVGLAIVQRIVHRHGGTVWAEGRPNAGATFYFTLPIQKEADDGDDQRG